MRRKLVLLFAAFALLAGTVSWADAVEDVRRTELAFAKAFADRDAAKFFSFVADDATFGLAHGKQKVIERWSPLVTSKEPPFSWGPGRVSVNAAGTIALSTGPVYDAAGKHAGSFITTWVKQEDGAWKALFDSSGPGPANLAEDALKTEEGFVTTTDGLKLHYKKVGQGRATVIIPLSFALHEDFKQLADTATVITYDPRGRGHSQKAANPATALDDVRDLEAVRLHFKLERCVPIGFGEFGRVVALYAAGHPERVARIIQLAPEKSDLTAEQLKTITMPVLTIHGKDDRDVPYASGREWAASFPDARLVTVDHAAHRSWADDPVTVFSAIRPFLYGEWPLGSEKVAR